MQSDDERAPIGTMFTILSHDTNYCIVDYEQTDGPAAMLPTRNASTSFACLLARSYRAVLN